MLIIQVGLAFKNLYICLKKGSFIFIHFHSLNSLLFFFHSILFFYSMKWIFDKLRLIFRTLLESSGSSTILQRTLPLNFTYPTIPKTLFSKNFWKPIITNSTFEIIDKPFCNELQKK